MNSTLIRRKVPYVPQMELAECGAACLAMVVGYHGRHLPLAEARRLCGVSRDGSSAYAIAKAAQALGLTVRAARVAVREELSALPLPAIVHWKGNHFVVLSAITAHGAAIVDPTVGPRRVSIGELDTSCAGVVLTFEPGPDFVRSKKPRPSLRRYASVLGRSVPAVALVLLASLLLELVGMIFPAASQVVIDSVLRDKQERWLWTLAGVLAGATLVRLLLTWLRDRVVHVLHQALDLAFMGSFMNHLLRLPVSFFQQRTTGDLMSRVVSNVELRSFTSRAMLALLDGFLLVGYAALMLAYERRLGALVIGLSVLRVLVVSKLQGRAASSMAIEQAARGREAGTAVEAFAVPEVTKAFRMERRLLERYTGRLFERLNASAARRRMTDGVGQIAVVLDGATLAAILLVGGRLVLRDQMPLGIFSAFLALSALVARPLASLLGAHAELIHVQSVLARLDDIWETPVEPTGAVDPGVLAGRITLEDVSFRYGPSGAKILDGISLDVRPGEKVALVGPSGAGKSTLARLMLGLEVATEGVVRIDGHDLRELEVARVRRQIGVVHQDPYVFDDSARANLSLADPEAPLALLEDAARRACIDEVIAALPRGYDTRLGERGRRLSGGQRQRLAIARAIAQRPRILLLDEATSSLDLPTEARVQENLGALACTRVVIAHRLATVRDADRIVVLDGGRIVQEGAYAELATRPGLFQDMLTADIAG